MDEPAAHVPGRTHWLRVVGVVLFLASAALPLTRCAPPPVESGSSAAFHVVVVRVDTDQGAVPWREIGGTLAAGWREGGPLQAVWKARTWYPYLLAPLWLLALLWTPRLAPAGRRRLGVFFLVLGIAIAVLEACYIATDFQGLFVGTAGVVEDVVAWSVVAAVLFVRPGGRPLLDPVAAVAGQALLGFLHAMTFPAYDVLTWASQRRGLAGVVEGLVFKYRPAFWLALAGLLLAAAPAYLARRRQAEPLAATA
jgi:hypothetical protein